MPDQTSDQTTQPQRPRALAYLRISNDPNQDRLAVMRQEKLLRQLAAQVGADLREEDIHIDNDTSATSTKKSRVEFERAMTKINRSAEGTGPHYDVFLAYKIDRLTRNLRDTVRIYEAGKAAKITIMAGGQTYNLAESAGRQTFSILAAIAQGETETKHERQMAQTQQRRERGKAGPSPRPFGYKKADRTELEPDEAQAVRDAYGWLIDGMSLGAIARRWNDLGLLTPSRMCREVVRDENGDPIINADGSVKMIKVERGRRPWVGNSVGPLLRNPRNIGMMTYLEPQANGSKVKRKITGEAKWEKIIDPTSFHAALAILDNPKRTTARGDKALLTGVATCAVCGGRVAAANNGVHGLYRCLDQQHFHRRRDPIDEYVRDKMIIRIMEYAAEDAAQTIDVRSPAGALHAQRLRVIAKQEALIREHNEAGDDEDHDLYVPEHLYRQMRRENREQLRKIDEQLASIKIETTDAQLKALADAPDIGKAWDELDRDVQRELISKTMIIKIDRQGKGVKTFRAESVIIESKRVN